MKTRTPAPKPLAAALAAVLMLVPGPRAPAQDAGPAREDNKLSVGLGAEWNMDAYVKFAAGAVLSLDYDLFRCFAAGFTLTASTNFAAFTALEPAAMFRWYFSGKKHTGWFAQADAGVFLYMENAQTVPMFLGGLRTGYRLALGQVFYLEPYGRVGYPFVFGIGVAAGTRFALPKKQPSKEPEKTAPPPEYPAQ